MTEKRFTINRKVVLNKIETYQYVSIIDTETKNFYFVIDDLANVESFVERLNKLAEENEQLKQQLAILRDFRNFITEKNVSNEKKRKKLQLQMLRLYNYFENYFEDTMNPNAFSEMWDNVKDDERWD
ncbi:MAG: hypothetical protein J6Y78_04440 [Paludibacteraceae bacterium]|nr:hypothetical protein [Paludibacteraceae bacterium]